MNTYTYEEIAIGQKESFTAALTAEQMEQFRQITGDDNPLHIGVAVIESTPGGGGGGPSCRSHSLPPGVPLVLFRLPSSSYCRPLFLSAALSLSAGCAAF